MDGQNSEDSYNSENEIDQSSLTTARRLSGVLENSSGSGSFA